MKDELAKQSEEHFKAFEKLLSSNSHGLNEELITNIPAIVTNIQNDEKMNNILEEVTKIKEELVQEVIATQQNLEMTTQKFEKELTTVKGEFQSCHSEARKAKDSHTQSLKSMQAKLTTSQLVSPQHEEGKVSGKLTQEIKNIKNIRQNLSETKKLFNQKLKCAKENITAIREEMKKSHEELSVVKQKQVIQVAALATSHNKWKENLNLISNFVIIVIFAVLALAASFSSYNTFCDVNNITEEFNTSCQHLMRNLSVDLMLNISSNQGVQIQRLNDTLNAMQLQIKSESELVELLHKNISAVNQTTLSIVNDIKAQYDHEVMEISALVTELSSKVNASKDDQVLQLQKIAGIEEDLNITRSHDVQNEIKIAELAAELNKNISGVNQTALKTLSDMRRHFGNDIMKMRNLIKDCLSNVIVLRNNQGLHSQRLDDIEEDIIVTKSFMQTESELVAKLHKNISAVNQTTLSIVDDVKAHYEHEITEISTLVTELSSKVDTLKDDQVLQLQKLTGIEEDFNITKSYGVQNEIKMAELVVELHKNISGVNHDAQKTIHDLTQKLATVEKEIVTLKHQISSVWSIDLLNNQAAKLLSGNEVFPVVVKMSEFTKKKRKGIHWYSEPFFTQPNGYKMQMKVLPNGDVGRPSGSHLSVSLYVMKGPHDEQLEWPMKGEYEVKLLNQNSDSMHHSVTSSINVDNSYKPTGTRNKYAAWYSKMFISHDALTATKHFLKGDNIYFRVCKPLC